MLRLVHASCDALIVYSFYNFRHSVSGGWQPCDSLSFVCLLSFENAILSWYHTSATLFASSATIFSPMQRIKECAFCPHESNCNVSQLTSVVSVNAMWHSYVGRTLNVKLEFSVARMEKIHREIHFRMQLSPAIPSACLFHFECKYFVALSWCDSVSNSYWLHIALYTIFAHSEQQIVHNAQCASAYGTLTSDNWYSVMKLSEKQMKCFTQSAFGAIIIAKTICAICEINFIFRNFFGKTIISFDRANHRINRPIIYYDWPNFYWNWIILHKDCIKLNKHFDIDDWKQKAKIERMSLTHKWKRIERR